MRLSPTGEQLNYLQSIGISLKGTTPSSNTGSPTGNPSGNGSTPQKTPGNANPSAHSAPKAPISAPPPHVSVLTANPVVSGNSPAIGGSLLHFLKTNFISFIACVQIWISLVWNILGLGLTPFWNHKLAIGGVILLTFVFNNFSPLPLKTALSAGHPGSKGSPGQNSVFPKGIQSSSPSPDTGNPSQTLQKPNSETPKTGSIVLSTKASVHFRTGPGKNFPILKKLPQGTRFIGTGITRDGKWVKGHLENGSEGFVAASYLVFPKPASQPLSSGSKKVLPGWKKSII